MAALAAVVLLVLTTASGGADQPGGRTLQWFERSYKTESIDNPPTSRRRYSPGDMTSGTSKLLGQGKETIGTQHLVCFATKSGRTSPFQCDGTFVLADGRLTYTGVQSAGSSKDKYSITGGTDSYEGARGSLFADCGRIGCDDTVHLLP
jgi:hypothetical protein